MSTAKYPSQEQPTITAAASAEDSDSPPAWSTARRTRASIPATRILIEAGSPDIRRASSAIVSICSQSIATGTVSAVFPVSAAAARSSTAAMKDRFPAAVTRSLPVVSAENPAVTQSSLAAITAERSSAVATMISAVFWESAMTTAW